MDTNQFYAFKITIPGQCIDNKVYYRYSDWDVNNTSVPTDAETVTKGKAFIRFKQFERLLSELVVPQYITVEFETPGTTAVVPTDATVVVGYRTIHPFLDTLDVAPVAGQEFEAAADVIKQIVLKSLSGELVEFAEIQKTITRPKTALTPSEMLTYKEPRMEYLTAPNQTPLVVVEYIKL